MRINSMKHHKHCYFSTTLFEIKHITLFDTYVICCNYYLQFKLPSADTGMVCNGTALTSNGSSGWPMVTMIIPHSSPLDSLAKYVEFSKSISTKLPVMIETYMTLPFSLLLLETMYIHQTVLVHEFNLPCTRNAVQMKYSVRICD